MSGWIAVLGAGRDQVELIRAAKRAGYSVVSFDANSVAVGGFDSDRFFSISNRDTERIVGVLAQSGGFFLHMGVGQPGRGSPGTTVTSVGALILVAAIVLLAYGLIVA